MALLWLPTKCFNGMEYKVKPLFLKKNPCRNLKSKVEIGGLQLGLPANIDEA